MYALPRPRTYSLGKFELRVRHVLLLQKQRRWA